MEEGKSDGGNRQGGTPGRAAWSGGPGHPARPDSHLIHRELVLGLAQLPVARGELTNEIMAVKRPEVGQQQLPLVWSHT